MPDFSTPGDIDLYPGDKKTKDFLNKQIKLLRRWYEPRTCGN